MIRDDHVHLTRRERQIMDALYESGEATVGEVRDAIPSAPSYSAVRALLRKLLDKGHVAYRDDRGRYVYRPVVARAKARRSAVDRVVETFYGGSAAAAVVGLLGSKRKLSDDEVASIEAVLAKFKRTD